MPNEKISVRGVGDLATSLLGGHVRNGAYRGACLRQLIHPNGGGLGLAGASGFLPHVDFGESEVQDLDLSTAVEEDVGRLQIAVDDSLRVSGLERIRHLDRHRDELSDVDRSSPHLLEKGLTLEKLHDDEVRALVLFDCVDSADTRVVQRRSSTRFALKALQRSLVLRHFLWKELECDPSSQLRVFGFVDDTHSAAAELRGNLVMGDGLSNHSRPPGKRRS